MKIAVITSGILPFPPVRGGAVENLIDFYVEYNELKPAHQFTVFSCDDVCLDSSTLSRYRQAEFVFVSTRSLAYRLRRYWFKFTTRYSYYGYFLDYFVHSILGRIAAGGYDVVLIENRPGFVVPIAQVTKGRVLLHLHNDTFFKDTLDAQRIAAACTGIITVSDYIRHRVLSVGLQTSKVLTVYNGVDLQRFSPQNQAAAYDVRSKWGLAESDFVVAFVGRIEPIKGLKELLEAFLLLPVALKCIKLMVVGSASFGSNADSHFSLEVKRLAALLGNRVVFTGFVPYQQIPSLLAACDVGCVPSVCEEAFSLAAIEGMAVGLPQVVTRSGGLPEVVDTSCAIVVENDANLPSSLAQQIGWMYQHPDARAQMSQAACKRALKFGKESYARTMLEVAASYPFDGNSIVG